MWFKYFASTLLLAVVICCVANSFAKEVGPTSDNANKYPFLVSVRVDGIHLCTGTIIRPSWILIASSCIRPKTYIHRISIQYGVQKLTRDGSGVIPIRNLVAYEPWDHSRPHIGDIALIGLQEPLTYNDKVSPVVLPTEEIDLDDKLTTLVGWTFNMVQRPTSFSFGDVQAVTLKVQDNEQCANRLGFWGNITTNICTEKEDNGATHPCLLFGGPLMYDGVQVGIASQRPDVAFCTLPNVYIKISYYLKWINMQISDS